jgi:transposase
MALVLRGELGVRYYPVASIIAKQKANQRYYYVVESARVNGQPRIVHQTYLGTADRLAALVKDRTAPVPLSATLRAFGLPGALWLAAQQTGVMEVLTALWPPPRSGPSAAHYLLLAAIHRICQPGPKTEISEWYRHSVLASLWGFPPERFTSQAFWDCFDALEPETPAAAEPVTSALDRAQVRLLGLWRDRQQVSQRLLAYDTTNFYTYIATTNTRTQLAQRGHNKQGRHNLRQVGLSYVLDGEHGLSLCHHVYRGDTPDVDEVSTMLARIGRLLDQQQMPRDTVTLVMDKGAAALANTVAATEAGFGWIVALPWTQAPVDLRDRAVDDLPAIATAPGVHATAEHRLVHGRDHLCVVKYSASFAGEQLQSVTTSLAKTLQALRRLSVDLGKPKARLSEDQIRRKIDRWLAVPHLAELIHYTLDFRQGHWHLQFTFDHTALQRLMAQRLGRTILLTNRLDWTAEHVIAGYDGQQQIEQVFRGLKDGEWLGWGPMYHWTDSKIRVHAFYCLLGVSLLQTVYRAAQAAWVGLSMERLLDELGRIQEVVLLYPPQGESGPPRAATVLSTQTLPQQALVKTLGLDQLHQRHSR